MPKPVRGGQRYLPGLDGLRALAVLAVIAYHLHLGWARGGLLGVGVFFTLSGYLITDLLLGRWRGDGRLHLGDFWLRRARRLLPALFVLLVVVAAWVTLLDRGQLADLRGAVAAAATYVSNWYYIAHHSSYFARFAPPAPLDHLWSLAVEEQFYLCWPWLLWLGLRFVPGRRASRVRWLAAPTLALAVGSSVLMAFLYHPGLDPTRVYEGTDTRAFGLLAGAALAMVWPSGDAAATGRRARRTLDGAGVAGLAVIGVLVWQVGHYSPFAYRGGLGLLSVATVAVLAAVANPASLLGRALGWRPLRWVGVRSYGIYLWHYPVIVLTSAPNAGEDLPRAALQVTASVALAALSWRFVEEPVRHGALGRLWAQVRASWRGALPTGARGWAAVTGASGLLAVACVGLAGVAPGAGAGIATTGAQALGGALPSRNGAHADGRGKPAAGPSSPSPSPSPSGSASPSKSASPSPSGSAGPARTSCHAVAHLGDSTSEGMISPDYLPNPAQRLTAQYHDVGVSEVRLNISGARSVVETLPGKVNGYDAARSLVQSGYHGCWVIALGTNDTADVAVGSNVGRMARIKRMMSVADGSPVLWVNVKTLRHSGPYAESNMRTWNAVLRQACARFPNMRVFNWASVAHDSWFIKDGVHYTSAGYAARGHLIARALAQAFPASGQRPGCVVG